VAAPTEGSSPRLRIKPLDLVIAIAAIAAIVLVSVRVYAASGTQLRAVIKGQGGEWVYPLDVDRRVEIPGPLGLTTVEIHGKAVHVTDSPCKNKTCIAAGDIVAAGQWVACLPNKVFVRIEDGEPDGRAVDAGAF